MMQPGQKKTLQQPIATARTAFGQGRGMDWADGAVQTLFGSNGGGASQTLFGGGGTGGRKEAGPTMATLATDILLIGVKILETTDLGEPDKLRRLLVSYFKDFERACGAYGKPPEAAEQARYALAAFIDETIINSENNCRDAWIAEPLQVQFFNDNLAGETFFKRLETLLTDLRRHVETLEVYYFCLALGFQGRYRMGGAEVLPNVVRNLLKRLESVKGQPPKAVSPSAYIHPGTKGRESSGRGLIIASAVLLLLSAALGAVLMTASDGALDPARGAVERLEGGSTGR